MVEVDPVVREVLDVLRLETVEHDVDCLAEQARPEHLSVTALTANARARTSSSRCGLSIRSSRRLEPLKSSAFSVDMPPMNLAGPCIVLAGRSSRCGVARSPVPSP